MKTKQAKAPARPVVTPATVVPCEWTQGNEYYTANGSPLIGYWLRCWRAGRLVSAVWYADETEVVEAIQEAKRS